MVVVFYMKARKGKEIGTEFKKYSSRLNIILTVIWAEGLRMCGNQEKTYMDVLSILPCGSWELKAGHQKMVEITCANWATSPSPFQLLIVCGFYQIAIWFNYVEKLSLLKILLQVCGNVWVLRFPVLLSISLIYSM